MLTENEQFEFFWAGPFSQWHICKFNVRGVSYNCAEQFMMAQKALLFGDEATFQKIMNTSNPREQKKLGREVVNFDKATWDTHRYTIVLAANMAKFSQNDDLKDMLMRTELKTLVEASPYDKIWGIGLAETDRIGNKVDAVYDRNQWQGINLLGQALTQIREQFKYDNFMSSGFNKRQ